MVVPITFLSPGTEDYVDLSKTILVVRAKVTKADGTRAVARALIGGLNIHIFVLCPTNFF